MTATMWGGHVDEVRRLMAADGDGEQRVTAATRELAEGEDVADGISGASSEDGGLTRGGAEAAREAHNLEDAGSSPAPATNPEEPRQPHRMGDKAWALYCSGIGRPALRPWFGKGGGR